MAATGQGHVVRQRAGRHPGSCNVPAHLSQTPASSPPCMRSLIVSLAPSRGRSRFYVVLFSVLPLRMDWAAVARGKTRLSAERASSTPGATSACAMYTRPGSFSNDLEPALLIRDNDEAEKQDIYRDKAARKKGVSSIEKVSLIPNAVMRSLWLMLDHLAERKIILNHSTANTPS